ncbi:ATP-binding protein [Acidicapsa acidisoli]|uniref:ATP-binding protein n=1 Tax=Acidicapsa acidisoli TaxID=1615681 RepID=UPI0037C04E0D
MFQDSRGQIWVSTNRDFGYLAHDRFVPISGFPGGIVDGIAEDGRGDLWVANQNEGLIHLSANRVVEEIPWTRLGHKENAKALTADAVRGGLWLGFYDGGVEHFADGKIQESYTAADGLRKGSVNSFRIEQDGTLWAATEGGLSRLKDGRFLTLGSKNGLPCDGVHWTVEGDDRSLWLYMQCGLIRIARPDVEGWTVALDKDDKRSIAFTAFDGSDGTPTFAAALWRYTPAVTKLLDGRIWFKAFEGVSVIDPHHLPFNKLPPPVHIEQVTADRKTYWQNWSGDASSSLLRLPPLVRDLTIDYTALSLVMPEKVHFRFKLEGQDRDWREVVNDREVQYSNLVPGKYRFRVTACNNSGVWNEAGAFLDLSVAPTFYQTNWFRALCVAAFLTLVWVLYRLRIQQVRHQERKLRDVVETMPTFAWTTLPDGSVDFVNRHWQEYTGLSTESTVGSGWQAAVHPQDLKRHAEKWRASVATDAPFENEVRYRRAADGQYRWFLTRAVPLRDARGKIVKWYGVSTDIEDRKRAEELQADLAHITRVNTMVELTASLAHDIKQPIGAAVTNAEACARLLDRDQPDVLEAREAALEMARDARRAAQIIDRVRSLYRKDSSHWDMVDVNEIVGEMVMLLRGESQRYGISVRTELAEELPTIKADRVQLQQVFMNLMLNAIEAMKETGGDLSIRSQQNEDGELLVSVTDNGVGLPAGRADEIFNAFFTTKSQGTGLGLAITRSIVESHGGRIWATANSERGTTFYFTLSSTVA